MIFLKAKPSADLDKITKTIEEENPDLMTIRSLENLGSVDQVLQIMDTTVLIVSVIALVIGGMGLINIMPVSMFKRTREIGTPKLNSG
jgi:putative ABC transport system permease protein